MTLTLERAYIVPIPGCLGAYRSGSGMGPSTGDEIVGAVEGDPARQAIASLRGYAYQLYVSVLAWIGLSEGEVLHLEVAEDYAIATRDALEAVQVKDTADSGSLTLRNGDVISAIDGFVDIVARNPGRAIQLRFLSTAEMGRERSLAQRPDGVPGLQYWRQAAAGADVAPLREVLNGLAIKPETRAFIAARDDAELRRDLLTRMHWDCGRPDLEAVQEELDLSLAAMGVRAGLTVAEGRDLGLNLLATALRTVVTPGSRRLSPVDLRARLEAASHLALPRRQVAALIAGGRGDTTFDVAGRGETLPSATMGAWPRALARRDKLTADIGAALQAFGLAALSGGTGMGKTLLARLAAQDIGGDWRRVDLLGLSVEETAARLNEVLAASGLETFSGVILDDLNGHEDPQVERRLAVLAAGLRRRDRLILITSYAAPSVRLLDVLGLSADAAFAIERMTVRETADLVAAADGDPDRWARALYMASGPGHPQLLQALIADLRRREWPQEAKSELDELKFGDLALADERLAVRRRLVRAASADARRLLDRLSLLIGSFPRDLVLRVADLPPPVADAGAVLDGLLGPWIETTATGGLRLSPLLAGSGPANLTLDAQKAVHRCAAEGLLGSRTLDVSQAAAVLVHGLAGDADGPLTGLAAAIISASEEDLVRLARWLIPLRALRTDAPIYPSQPTISRLLRFAQALIEAEAKAPDALSTILQALWREIAADDDVEGRERFEFAVLGKLLLHRNVAAADPEWLDLLLRFDALRHAEPEWAAAISEHEAKGGAQRSVVGFMFLNLTLGLSSVASLLSLFERLDTLAATTRETFLVGLRQGNGDEAHVVNHAWIADQDGGRLEGAGAAQAYARMAELADTWDQPGLAMRCRIAQAVMLDEYVDQRDEAAAVLDAAQQQYGHDVAISRARAKMLFRRREHSDALVLLSSVAAELDHDTVELAFVSREAGISAGFLGRWADARTWFEAARSAALKVESPTMKAMAVGLGADAAVMARHAGDDVAALQGLWQACESLGTLDPKASVRNGALHRLVRHAVLWLNGELTAAEYTIDDRSPQVSPGFCSNPDPSPKLIEHPLTDLEGPLYLLGMADFSLDGAAGVAVQLSDRLNGSMIRGLEVGFRKAQLEHTVRQGERPAVAKAAARYLEGHLWLLDDPSAMQDEAGLPLVAGPFPQPSANALADPRAQTLVEDVMQFVLVHSVLNERDGAAATFEEVAAALAAEGYPADALLSEAKAGGSRIEAKLVAAWVDLAGSSVPAPDAVFVASLRLLAWSKSSMFRKRIEGPAEAWTRNAWRRVLTDQRFLLRSPVRAADDIQLVMDGPKHGFDLVADLLRAAFPHLRVNLGESARQFLATA